MDDEREAGGSTNEATEGCADEPLRRESRSSLQIVGEAVQPKRHDSLSLQPPAAAANVFYAMLRSTRGAVVILLYRMTRYEAPVAGWCAEAYP